MQKLLEEGGNMPNLSDSIDWSIQELTDQELAALADHKKVPVQPPDSAKSSPQEMSVMGMPADQRNQLYRQIQGMQQSNKGYSGQGLPADQMGGDQANKLLSEAGAPSGFNPNMPVFKSDIDKQLGQVGTSLASLADKGANNKIDQRNADNQKPWVNPAKSGQAGVAKPGQPGLPAGGMEGEGIIFNKDGSLIPVTPEKSTKNPEYMRAIDAKNAAPEAKQQAAEDRQRILDGIFGGETQGGSGGFG